MVLYRISGKSYTPQDPTGAAASSEGRWHLLGQRILYFSSSLSLSVLELKVNGVSFETIRKNQHYLRMDVDETGRDESIPKSFYSPDWMLDKRDSQRFGADWYTEKRSLFLVVRSAILPVEWNCLVNTLHPDFSGLSFASPLPVPLDPRLK